jgi:sigma-B regulation protein RsbU (phosphoserine phosphatase)
MQTIDVEILHQQLLERRQKLQKVAASGKQSEEFADLLTQVDLALDKIDKGSYGLCETCHDPIEAERLTVDPLIRNCLDHLSAQEQRLLERDLDLATNVQSNLLPKQGISCRGWISAYHYAPAGAVSGDYCDIVMPGDKNDRMYLFLGDVSGKGIAASLLMSHLHATFRTLINQSLPLTTVLAQANRLFCEGTAQKHFATLVCGSVDSGGGIELCNAAHCRPLILRKTGVEAIPSTSLPFGLFVRGSFLTQHIRLDRGESLLLYTDGLIEARNPANELYGEDRLMALVESRQSLEPKDIISSCLSDLSKFAGGAKQIDDLTLLAIQKNS